MRLKVIGSSSKGNCYVLETPSVKLLIECGVRFQEIQKALNFDLSGVVGCLISHSHKDHCKSFKEVTNSGIDTYLSQGTFGEICPGSTPGHRAVIVASGNQFIVSDFIVLPFDTEHDATEPLGYLIQYIPTGEKLLFVTDTYYVRYKFVGLNYILVECNYVKDIMDANIEAGRITEALKNRLLRSHFSLENVKGFLNETDQSNLKKIVLVHLSDGNSDAKRMQSEIETLTDIDTVVADSGMDIDLNLNPF